MRPTLSKLICSGVLPVWTVSSSWAILPNSVRVPVAIDYRTAAPVSDGGARMNHVAPVAHRQVILQDRVSLFFNWQRFAGERCFIRS